jgi:hypothetical protein
MKKNIFKILFIGFLFSSSLLFEVAEAAARSSSGKKASKKLKKKSSKKSSKKSKTTKKSKKSKGGSSSVPLSQADKSKINEVKKEEDKIVDDATKIIVDEVEKVALEEKKAELKKQLQSDKAKFDKLEQKAKVIDVDLAELFAGKGKKEGSSYYDDSGVKKDVTNTGKSSEEGDSVRKSSSESIDFEAEKKKARQARKARFLEDQKKLDIAGKKTRKIESELGDLFVEEKEKVDSAQVDNALYNKKDSQNSGSLSEEGDTKRKSASAVIDFDKLRAERGTNRKTFDGFQKQIEKLFEARDLDNTKVKSINEAIEKNTSLESKQKEQLKDLISEKTDKKLKKEVAFMNEELGFDLKEAFNTEERIKAKKEIMALGDLVDLEAESERHKKRSQRKDNIEENEKKRKEGQKNKQIKEVRNSIDKALEGDNLNLDNIKDELDFINDPEWSVNQDGFTKDKNKLLEYLKDKLIEKKKSFPGKENRSKRQKINYFLRDNFNSNEIN